MESINPEYSTPIENDVRLSITLDYREDNTLHTYAAIHIAPPFDNLLSPTEQEENVQAILISSDSPRPNNLDSDIIEDIHNLVKKIINRQYKF